MFPDKAKIVSTLDEHTDHKYSETEFRPVRVLNTFSKIYEKNTRDFFISKIEPIFHRLFPHTGNPFLMNMCLLDNNVAGAVLTDLSTTFDCIPHGLTVVKLDVYGFKRDAAAYILIFCITCF